MPDIVSPTEPNLPTSPYPGPGAIASGRALSTDPGAFGLAGDDPLYAVCKRALDIVLSLVNAEVESVEAVGVPVLTGRVDIANARLRFANGCIANLTASRISRDRVRKIRFFQPLAYVSIDYAAQKVDLWRLVKGSGLVPSIEGGEIDVVNEEPLKRELADFVDAVVARRAPLVTGEDGRRALALATQVSSKMGMSNAG